MECLAMMVRCSTSFREDDGQYDFDADVVPAVGDQIDFMIDGRRSGLFRVIDRRFIYDFSTAETTSSSFAPIVNLALLHIEAC
jgi:hypothetical protein